MSKKSSPRINIEIIQEDKTIEGRENLNNNKNQWAKHKCAEHSAQKEQKNTHFCQLHLEYSPIYSHKLGLYEAMKKPFVI